MDHFVKEDLGCKYYLRYMDDFVVFHEDKILLWQVKEQIVKYLAVLRLELHDGKCRVFRTDRGVPFLGLTIFPKRRRLKRANFVRYRRRLKGLQVSYREGKAGLSKVLQSIRAWIGHARHADTVRLREFLLGDMVFQRGRERDPTCSVAAPGTIMTATTSRQPAATTTTPTNATIISGLGCSVLPSTPPGSLKVES